MKSKPCAGKLLSLGLIFWAAAARSGVISGAVSGTLSVADSPYTVIGDLTVPANQTLTIEAGVVLRFDTNVSFFVDGTLTAEGTESDSIRFTSNSAQPNAGDWNGVFFRNAGAGTIKYAVVEYAATGITSTGTAPVLTRSRIRFNNNGVDCFSSSTALVQKMDFVGNANSAIRCNGASPTIAENVFRNNDVLIAVVSCDAASPVIKQNIFYNNSSSAIDCSNGAAPKIWHNTVVQNDFGVTITDSSPELVSNIIVLNGFGVQNDGGTPVVRFNDVWGNSNGDFQGTPAGVGDLTETNANGDPADPFDNIMLDPRFVNPGGLDFRLSVTSPCIDAGDPTNPAGVLSWGNAPDQGALEYDAAVPVELVSFEFVDGVLRWQTASETNNFGFEVQRSLSAETGFQRVGFVKGAGTTTEPQRYEFADSVSAGVYFYRLKQIDTDGSFEFSPVIKAEYTVPAAFALHQNYPNPFNPGTTISFRVPEDAGKVRLSVYNTLGQEIAVLVEQEMAAGQHQVRWLGVDKSGRVVAAGVYFYRLEVGSRTLTRKMILSR